MSSAHLAWSPLEFFMLSMYFTLFELVSTRKGALFSSQAYVVSPQTNVADSP